MFIDLTCTVAVSSYNGPAVRRPAYFRIHPNGSFALRYRHRKIPDIATTTAWIAITAMTVAFPFFTIRGHHWGVYKGDSPYTLLSLANSSELERRADASTLANIIVNIIVMTSLLLLFLICLSALRTENFSQNLLALDGECSKGEKGLLPEVQQA